MIWDLCKASTNFQSEMQIRNYFVVWFGWVFLLVYFQKLRLELKDMLLLEPKGSFDIGVSHVLTREVMKLKISRHVQSSAVCGCWFVNPCVMQHTSCQFSNLWHQLPVNFKIELWALRSAWTLTKSSYSSELSALHYYLLRRSTQAGITAHPESTKQLYKTFLCADFLGLLWCFSRSNPTEKSLFFHGLWNNMRDLILLLLRKQ